MLLQAHLATSRELVAQVSERLPPAALALFICLLFANLDVVEPADVLLLLLAISAISLLFLGLRAALLGDTPFTSPVSPHVGEVVGGQKWLVVFPVKGISTKDVIRKFRQDGCSLRVASDVLLQEIGVKHQPHDCTDTPVPWQG